MICQRRAEGHCPAWPASSASKVSIALAIIFLFQLVEALNALSEANETTRMDTGWAKPVADVHSIAHDDLGSDKDYFCHPYEGYDDWVVPGACKTAKQNETATRELNENNRAPQISIYSVSKRKTIMYDVLSDFWTRRSANGYSVKKFNSNENKPPIVKSALKIFWTMDKTNIADNIRIIAIRERENERLPVLPMVADVGRFLDKEDRLRVIQNTLQEAFDYWSSILFGRVIFEYVEYDSRLKNSPYFNMVIVISMKDMIHTDEHTNAAEGFTSRNTLAHASTNFVHFNRQTSAFYIAPHLTSKRVYIAVERKNGINNGMKMGLYGIPSEELVKRYRFKTYTDLYKKRQASLGRLLYQNNTKSWCFLCVAIHEIGHVIGLGHANDRKSVMYKTYLSNEVIHNEDDKRAARKIYAGLINRIETREVNEVLSQCRKIRDRMRASRNESNQNESA